MLTDPKAKEVGRPVFFPELPFDDPFLHTPAVWHPEAPRRAWVRLHARRRFILAEAGAAHVRFSGSMRCELYLDGELVSRGPGRGDPYRWSVVACELGELDAGAHELRCRISHFGDRDTAPCGQLGPDGFLLVRGGGALAGLVDTDAGWEVRWERGAGHRPGSAWTGTPGTYSPMGSGEEVELAPPDEAAWVPAVQLEAEATERWGNLRLGARLRAEPLPARVEEVHPWTRLVEAGADDATPWARGEAPLHLAAGRRVRLVLDAGRILNAWPRVAVTGGTGSELTLTWAEAPRRETADGACVKVHRDDAAGRLLPGFRDRLRCTGCAGDWQPGWLRSFRYLELVVETAGEELILDPVELRRSHLPMRPAAVELAGPSAGAWRRVYDACWHSIDACAHESVWDCPVYEQCQFPGDTRLQALWHYAVCGWDASARLAIDDFHASRLPDGMLQCRWPSNRDQILPTYALHWVLMLDEFLRWRGEAEVLAGYLPVAREVLGWFLDRRRADGLPANIPYAPFVDWAPAFRPYGNAPQADDGGSAILACLVIQGCAALVRLEEACGWPELAPRWRDAAAGLRAAVREHCRDAGRGLVAETPARRDFSVHTQVEAANAGLHDDAAAALAAIDRALAAEDVSQPGTFFYHGQLLMARRALGDGDAVHERLGLWFDCLERSGLTTLPETMAAQPRSDCHAWSATPGLELVAGVLGLQPAPGAVGYDRVLWRPQLGPLEHAVAVLPHPAGAMRVELERRGGGVRGRLESPVPVLAAGREHPAGAVDLPGAEGGA